MLPNAQPGFCPPRGEAKIIFAQKLSNLGLLLNKLMQFERVTDRGLGTEPPNYWAVFEILQHKNSNFNGILITFRTF